MLIYTEKTSPRLNYTLKLFFKELLGLDYKVCTNLEEFLSFEAEKLCYTKSPIKGVDCYLQASNLLFETDIFDQEIQKSKLDTVPIFFLTNNKNSILPFDALAAGFYLVSRYEEYIPFIADEHGRFPAKESLQFKLGALKTPLVNVYTRMLKNELLKIYPNLKFDEPRYSFNATVDIDHASAFKGKGLFRTLFGFMNDLVQLDLTEFIERFKAVFGISDDPFENFWYVKGLQEKYNFNCIYFCLFTNFGQYDRSLTMHSDRLKLYIKGISDFCEVGIHPSYKSNSSVELLEKEKKTLEETLRKDVNKSRQHFLKLSFPETYRNLIDLEITHDYTMGYAELSGFRAGLCTPFNFYDLELEVETLLRIHPFPFMDGTYIYYQKKTAAEALLEIKSYIKLYKEFGGEFIPVWHNRLFSEKQQEWKSWNWVFEEMVKEAVSD